MVRGHATQNRLEKRMDRLLTITHHISSPKRQTSPIHTTNSQQTTTCCEGPLLHWQSHGGKHNHRREAKHPRPIPMTCQNIFRTRIPETTQTHSMGPCYRTTSGSSQYPTRTPLTSHPRRNHRSEEVRGGTPATEYHSTIMEPLRSQLFLCQKEGRQTSSCTGLPTTE